MDTRERKRLLLEAVEEAVSDRRQAETDAREAQRRREAGRNPAWSWGAVVAGWSFLAYVWIARPAWVFDPGRISWDDNTVAEASLRYSLYLERTRVDGFLQRRGRLPDALAEAGPVEDGVEFFPEGGSYALEGVRGAVRLRMSAAMDSDSFLGGSLRILADQEP